MRSTRASDVIVDTVRSTGATRSPAIQRREPAVRDASASWLLRAGLVAALLVALAGTSGLESRGRLIFAIAAGGAAAFAATESRSLAVAGRPALVALGALGLLELVSLAWTIGDTRDGAAWATAVLGAAALAWAAAVIASRPGGVAFLAAAIGVLAAASAVAGIAGVTTRSTPLAECLSGVWRAGGPFEYPPALALAGVSATPVALWWMCGACRRVAIGGLIVGALAASAIALSGSRAQIALAAVLVLWLIVWPGRLAASRGRMASAILAAAAAGIVCAALARSGLPIPAVGGLVVLVIGAAALGWVALRTRRRVAVPALAVAVAGATVLVVAMATTSQVACATPPDGGFTHGRIALWQAAGQTALERPAVGAGAATFALATAERQVDGPVRFAHSLPLELAVELGVLGIVAWLALVGGVAHALRRAWNSRALALLGPAVVAFLVANMLDWSWHLVGALAVFAVALGGLVGAGSRP